MLGMFDLRRLPLRAAFDHCPAALTVKSASPKTIGNSRAVLASYLGWTTTTAAPTLADFTLLQVRGYVAHLMGEHVRFAHHHNVRAGGRLSDYTINLHGRVLRSFAAWLAREKYTEEHVLARFRPLRPKTKPIVPLTPEEFRGMVAALTGPASLRARGRAMLFLLFDTGIRASKLVDSRLGDLDLEAGILRVRGKGSLRPGDIHSGRPADDAQHGAPVRQSPRAAGGNRARASAFDPSLDRRGASAKRGVGDHVAADLRTFESRSGGVPHAPGGHACYAATPVPSLSGAAPRR